MLTCLPNPSPQLGVCPQAPEQFEGRPVTEKVDVYAFAMSLWECLTGQQPWADLHNPMQGRRKWMGVLIKYR